MVKRNDIDPSGGEASRRLVRATDLRSLVELAAQATVGVSRVVEGVHQSVWGSMGVPGGKERGRTRGLTGLVYKSVQGVTELVGASADALLANLEPLFESEEAAEAEITERETVLAALNGVMGDRLTASENGFATSMTFRAQGKVLDPRSLQSLPNVTGKILLLVHGLCMNDLQWRCQCGAHRQHDHGKALASALGYTPVYLRYNSGLHISENGRELASRLGDLVEHWPVPIEELSVVAHSMGGLVSRSAVQVAKREQLSWLARLRSMAFLGTPHHGAPLEQAGNWLDLILGSTPYTSPFARLGQLRSSGITDLRYGHVMDEDWKGRDRFQREPDHRQIVPLPENVASFALAATLSPRSRSLADRLVGDGLVPVPSALGQHREAERTLGFAEESQWIGYGMNHMELLSRPEVARKLEQWLGPS